MRSRRSEDCWPCSGRLTSWAMAAGAMAVYASLQETAGLNRLNESGTNPLLGSTTSLQEQVSNFIIVGDDDYSDELTSLDQIETDLTDVEAALAEFTAIDSRVLISPFRSNVLQLSEVSISDIDFFVPAALALLIQHIAVSFAALSIIRERRLGTLELLRIAPSSALELLVGKTIGYLVVIILIASVLTALITLLMGVPMAGNWLLYAGILLAVMFLSLGIGFVISTISQTETQAVQLAMLLVAGQRLFQRPVPGYRTHLVARADGVLAAAGHVWHGAIAGCDAARPGAQCACLWRADWARRVILPTFMVGAGPLFAAGVIQGLSRGLLP